MARMIALMMLGIAAPALAQDDAGAEDGANDDKATPSMSTSTEDAEESAEDEAPKPTMGKSAPADEEADESADDEGEEEAEEEEAEEGTSMSKPPAEKPMVMTAPMALPPPPPPEDELPIPTLTIDRIPPNTSYEFAVQVSYGQVSYFRDEVPPWVGFGLRGAWGKNFGLHRLGGQLGFTSEGDMGVHTLLVLEPSLAYDVVTPFGLQLGASAGPAVMYWNDASTQLGASDLGFGPHAAVRVGWSQTWTRIGRRLFVFAEPKLRVAGGNTDLLVAIAVGSGAGR